MSSEADPMLGSYEFGQDRSPRGTSFGQIVLAVKKQLVLFLELFRGRLNARVKIVADRKIDPRAIAETHVRVRPMQGGGEENPGAGRLAAFKTRVIAIDLIIRHGTDEAAGDEAALCDEELGLFTVEEQILDLLDLHTPTMEDKVLTVQPMAKVHVDDVNRPEAGDGFVTSTVHFECRFVPPYLLKRI